jgi:outer membrane protein OmpA-like peptidoglycan-associated protein
VFIKGKVKDKHTQKPIRSLVELTNVHSGLVLDTTWSDYMTGEFLLVLQPGINYAFNITKKGYVFYSENYNLEDSISLHAIEKEFFLSPLETGTTLILENVFFDFDKSTLKAESFAELDRLYDVLDKNKSLKIKIDGHTDNVGEKEYNLKLSENRAISVFDYLTEKGIDPGRLKYEGFGDDKPLTSNKTEEGRAKNRRTEITLID